MNPMFQEALMSVLRWALSFLAGWFVQHGIWTGSQAQTYIGGAALAIVSLLWMLWVRYHSRVKFLMALTMAPGTTENEVKAAMKQGAPTPTVTTPPDTIPGVPK